MVFKPQRLTQFQCNDAYLKEKNVMKTRIPFPIIAGKKTKPNQPAMLINFKSDSQWYCLPTVIISWIEQNCIRHYCDFNFPSLDCTTESPQLKNLVHELCCNCYKQLAKLSNFSTQMVRSLSLKYMECFMILLQAKILK